MTTAPTTQNMGDSGLLIDIIKQHDWALTHDGCLTNGMELGVHRGVTSALLLKTFPSLNLWMVDSWPHSLPENHIYFKSGDGCAKLTAEQQEDNFLEAKRATQFAYARRTILKLTSEKAFGRCPLKRLGFVFVDASHVYEDVATDLRLWWQKVEPGGLFCGHDYGHPRDVKGIWGVARAVNEFVERENLKLSVTGTVWHLTRPLPPDSDLPILKVIANEYRTKQKREVSYSSIRKLARDTYKRDGGELPDIYEDIFSTVASGGEIIEL